MAFADDFATCMGGAGIQLDPGTIPDAQTLQSVIQYIKDQVGGLDSETSAALDQATSDAGAATIGFTDSSVGIVDPAYSAILQAFDAASPMPLSTALQWCDYCVGQATASNPQQ
jgi:hypothetical protein